MLWQWRSTFKLERFPTHWWKERLFYFITLAICFFQKWPNCRLHLQKLRPVLEDVQWLQSSLQLPLPFLQWKYVCSNANWSSPPLYIPASVHSDRCCVAPRFPISRLLSLQSAGPSGTTGTTPAGQETGSCWATWRQKTQEKSRAPPCTSRLSRQTRWPPRPSAPERPSMCEFSRGNDWRKQCEIINNSGSRSLVQLPFSYLSIHVTIGVTQDIINNNSPDLSEVTIKNNLMFPLKAPFYAKFTLRMLSNNNMCL